MKKTKKEMVQFNLILSKDMRDRVKSAAAEKCISANDLIRMLLVKELKKYKD